MNIENSGSILKPYFQGPKTSSSKVGSESNFFAGKAETEIDAQAIKSSAVLNQLKSPALGSRVDLLTQVIAKLHSGEVLSRQSAEAAAAAILDR